MRQPTPEQLQELGLLIFDEAHEIFEVCGEANDFCIQAIGTGAVFGGTNRLIWHPKHGFRPDAAYCRERFLSEYKAHYGR